MLAIGQVAFYIRTRRSTIEQIVYEAEAGSQGFRAPTSHVRLVKGPIPMTDARSRAAQAGPASQTLSRGIRILEVLADAREPLTIDDIARRLDVHRSVA